MYNGIPAGLADQIKMIVLDVDGVLTDNGIYVGTTESGEPVELKRFDIQDGLGINMIRRAGIKIALISGRHSAATAIRAKELGIDECHQTPGGRKMPAFLELMERHSLGWDDLAFVGDDLADLPAMRRVALPVAVANAVPEIKAEARWTSTRPGGSGAVREFAEALLKARGVWAGLIEAYAHDRS